MNEKVIQIEFYDSFGVKLIDILFHESHTKIHYGHSDQSLNSFLFLAFLARSFFFFWQVMKEEAR
jgi:hypothetical protein